MFKDLFKRKPPRQEPAVIENDLGRFEMEYYDDRNTRPAFAYNGYVSWPAAGGSDVCVEVPCDGDGVLTADRGFGRLRALLAQAETLDGRIKEAALEHLRDSEDGTVHIWGSCEDFPDGDDVISPEEFLRRVSVIDLFLQEDGSVSVFVSLDEMFTDHALETTLTPEGRFEDCKLIG